MGDEHLVRKIIAASAFSVGLTLAWSAAAAAGDASGDFSSWNGVYVGVLGGYESVSADWTSASYAGFPNPPVPSSKHADLDFEGAMLGGFAGYNMVRDRMLLGVEAEIDWTGGSASQHGIPGFYTLSTPGFTADDFVGDRIGISSDYEGSLRLRAGYFAAPDILVYGTGGLAFKQFERSFFCDGTGASGLSTCQAGPLFRQTDRSVELGWTLGAGIETHVTPNVIGRLEYRFSDYRMSDIPVIYNITTHNSAQTQAVTVGLVFRN